MLSEYLIGDPFCADFFLLEPEDEDGDDDDAMPVLYWCYCFFSLYLDTFDDDFQRAISVSIS
jgi:hypothetical protein